MITRQSEGGVLRRGKEPSRVSPPFPGLPSLPACLLLLCLIPGSLETLENTVLLEQGLCHLGNSFSNYTSHDISSYAQKDDGKKNNNSFSLLSNFFVPGTIIAKLYIWTPQ